MIKLAARSTDTVVPGGIIVGPGVLSVIIQSQPAAVVATPNTIYGNVPDTILKGSTKVFIGKMRRPAARMMDQTTLGGTIMTGATNVIIGG